MIGCSDNPVTYMALNVSDVLDSPSADSPPSMSTCWPNICVAVVEAVIDVEVEEELTAPFHNQHLYWRCSVLDANADPVLLTPYTLKCLIDHGSHAVLI